MEGKNTMADKGTYVRLIRHGESAANAGLATHDPAQIPLTETGVQQAEVVAQSFARAPRLILTSPFLRAEATAKLTAVAFPGVPVETWAIQEFTYLSPSRCANTTTAARRTWVEAYWEMADPDSCDGPGAETFRHLVQRAQAFLSDLAACRHEHIAVFSHGQFINAVAWLLQKKPTQIDRQALLDFRTFDLANPVENCWEYGIYRDRGQTEWIMGHQQNPYGTKCEHGEPLPVCGTMLVYAGVITAPPESKQCIAHANDSPEGPLFI